MLDRLRRAFRDDTGSALVDSAVGVIVLVVAMGAIASTAYTVGQVVSSTGEHAGAQSFLRSEVNTAAANPLSVPLTPAASAVESGGREYTLSSVRLDLADGRTLIRLAIPEQNADCTAGLATAPNYDGCYVTESTVSVAAPETDPAFAASAITATAPGVETHVGALVAADAGLVASFAPAPATQYVLGIKDPAAAGQVILRQGAVALATIEYAPGAEGWFYGTLGTTDLVTPVTVELVGGSATLRGLTAYEVSP